MKSEQSFSHSEGAKAPPTNGPAPLLDRMPGYRTSPKTQLDCKTGATVIRIGSAAIGILAGIDRKHPVWVFPASAEQSPSIRGAH